MITSSKYDIAGFDFIVFDVYHAALVSDTHYTYTLYIILFPCNSSPMHGFEPLPRVGKIKIKNKFNNVSSWQINALASYKNRSHKETNESGIDLGKTCFIMYSSAAMLWAAGGSFQIDFWKRSIVHLSVLLPFFQEKNSSIVEKRQHGYQKTTILSRKKVQK